MNNGCTSHSDRCSCELLERPRYFPRQLVSDVDMTLDQAYFRNKLRLHNRMLHGWGVVCGAIVCRVPGSAEGDSGDCDNGGSACDGYKPWTVVVKRGYILGPYGDEIVIGCEHEVDLRSAGVSGVSGESTKYLIDPWCCEGTVKREPGCYWIAVKYNECKTRPVRVQPIGCGCDETQCEYSRWRDGYEIGILDYFPESHQSGPEGPKIPHLPGFKEFYHGHVPCCPPCPEEPWVVLAKVRVDDNGCVELIDNCSCRRLVFSFSHLWWRCCEAPLGITEVRFDEQLRALTAGETDVSVSITGIFPANAAVKFGSGVKVVHSPVAQPTSELIATAVVDPDIEPGEYNVKVIDPCGRSATRPYEVHATEETEDSEVAPPRTRAKKKARKGRRTKKK